MSRRPEKPAAVPSYHSEMAMFGACVMGDAEAVCCVVRRVREWHLARDMHKPLLKAIQALYQASGCTGRGVDVTTLYDALNRANALDTVPGAYLVVLIQECPSSANVNAYIDAVIEKARLRALQRLGEEIANMASDEQTPSEAILRMLRQRADKISGNNSTFGEWKPPKETNAKDLPVG